MLQSLTDYLIVRLPQISYLMATVLMLFAADYVTERVVIKSIRRFNLVVRTGLFLAYAVVAVPAAVVISAEVLAAWVLEPYKSRIVLILLVFFVLTSILLSIKYRMRLF